MPTLEWLEFPSRERKPGQVSPSMLEPQDASGYFAKGEELRNLFGDFEAAAECYQRAARFEPSLYDAWTAWVDTELRNGRIDEAEAAAKEAMSHFGQVNDFYSAMGLVFVHKEKPRKAARFLDIGNRQGQGAWYPWLARAEFLLATESAAGRNLEAAKSAVQKALDAAPKHQWKVYLWAGLIFEEYDHPTLAAVTFSESLHLRLENPFGWVKLGDCFKRLEFFDRAEFYYRQAMDVYPGFELAARRLGQVPPAFERLLRFFGVRKNVQTQYTSR